jgi:hypothetical protein
MERTWAIWEVVGRHKQAEMEFRCRNDVDLEPRGPKFSNQCGLSQINAIRASDIWRGRPSKILERSRSENGREMAEIAWQINFFATGALSVQRGDFV